MANEADPSFNGISTMSTGDMYWTAVKELPSAAKEFALEAYAHPIDMAEHVANEAISSAVIGGLIGYAVPARGPAAAIVAAAFTIPMAISAVRRLDEAYEDSQATFADKRAIAHSLAKDTVVGGFDLTVNLAGGYAGTEVGYDLAHGDTALGGFAQSTHRGIMKVENESLLLLKSGMEGLANKVGSLSSFTGDVAVPSGVRGIANLSLEPQLATGTVARSVDPEQQSLWKRPAARLGRRMDQYSLLTRDLPSGKAAGDQDLALYFGSTHGHSRYSDGLGLPEDLFNLAIKEGQQVTAITDHNHLAAREGVKPGDPRSTDEQGTPIVAANPAEYVDTQRAAAATTIPGKHVSLYGIEMGTIGGVGHTHGGGHGHGEVGDAGGTGAAATGDAASALPTAEVNPHMETMAESVEAVHLGGVNHINVLEAPTFFEAVRQPKPHNLISDAVSSLLGRDNTVMQAPDVVKYNDGDYAAMVKHLAGMKDSTGNPVVITLNHPRFSADSNPSLPEAQRGRDYGRKSFKDDDQWRSDFVKPYVRGIELIKGGALNPDPVDKVPPGMIDLQSYIGYLGLNVEAGPVFGRDFHFGNPVGNPGSTGFLATALDKPSILNAMRERRTIATTNAAKLNGYLVANDKFVMGSILDQAAVPDLSLKMKIGGEIDPNAKYTLKLYSDAKVLDGKNAEVTQTKTVTGQQILDANGEVAFDDQVTHKLGNTSLHFVEVDRVDPTTNNTDKMWTSPIWVEPLSGDQHGLATRLLAGNAAQYLPWHQNFAFAH